MKPPPFDYASPRTVDEALELLARHGSDAKLLAGGQSLIPTMNFRLARPSVLIDLNRVAELDHVTPVEGGVRIGAMARQRAVERSELVAERAPLVHETMPWIAHPQIRNRGTFGGSVAHADPAAELPALVLALDARLHVAGPAGERVVAGGDFFRGLFKTAVGPDEMLTAVELRAPAPREGWAFTELARRHGDYALVGLAARVRLDTEGRCDAAWVALLSVGPGPVLAERAGDTLVGEAPGRAVIEAAARAVAEDLDPPGDMHASSEYRKHLAGVLARRALERAFARVGGASEGGTGT